ncbi:hypothetical protein F0562_019678 [Nyssa sinensis]|uniref:Pentacotripeptide-repeat region of PRORP domain-containing protein n=1 Tax=Nyssa sinensis TaxID=561372 RepID=A0A5J5BT25_9ASTE|nr:hypothetical protein F0562_019678 [Nyssa sinensis]
MPERNVFTWNAIIWANIKANNLTQAQALFDSAPHKDSVTYNSILSGYVSTDGYESHALKLFVEMQSRRGETRIDDFTLTTMLNLTAKLGVSSYGRQLHSFMVKTANDSNEFAGSALIDMYSKCRCFQEACQVFNGYCGGVRDLVSKNAMVAACCREGYAQNGYEDEALNVFGCMVENGVKWNEHTFASILSACANIKNISLGKEVHAWALKDGLSSNMFISSGIVDVYCKCGNMKYAESVHASIGMENTFSTTSMIVGYSSQANMVEARKHFDSLAEKNPVVWTALFSGYVKSQQCEAVFGLLTELNAKEATAPDALILVSVLGACAIQAAMDPGKQIHAYMLRARIEMDEKLISAIVDMYSKCGNIMYAQRIFRGVHYRDSVIYNVMMAGYAHHGFETEAIQLFEEMLDRRVRPDAVTFIALLSACRHCGLVEVGEKYFYSMKNDYAITPEIDHYACMIDLYGRANQLDKAVTFMREIPVELDGVILGTFLNACKINRNVELARDAEKKLLRIERDNGARYVQLANVYAAEGNWIEMGRIRKKMRGNEVKKLAGCSWSFLVASEYMGNMILHCREDGTTVDLQELNGYSRA